MLNTNDFHQLMEDTSLAWSHRDFSDAFSFLKIIVDEGTPEMKAQGFLLSGMIKNDQGKLVEARQDWSRAIPQTRTGTFILYSLQNAIADSFLKEGLTQDALEWYRSAICTCAEGDEFSAEKALTAFLEIHNGEIPLENQEIVARVVEKSWRVLEVLGKPDLNDLPKAITELNEGFKKLLCETKKDV